MGWNLEHICHGCRWIFNEKLHCSDKCLRAVKCFLGKANFNILCNILLYYIHKWYAWFKRIYKKSYKIFLPKLFQTKIQLMVVKFGLHCLPYIVHKLKRLCICWNIDISKTKSSRKVIFMLLWPECRNCENPSFQFSPETRTFMQTCYARFCCCQFHRLMRTHFNAKVGRNIYYWQWPKVWPFALLFGQHRSFGQTAKRQKLIYSIDILIIQALLPVSS